MKKILFFMALCIALISCKSKNDVNALQTVKFNVQGMSVTTTPMNSPRKAPIYDGEGTAESNQITNIYLFDGVQLIKHQQNTDPDFGTIEVQLELGEHHLHFVATSSKCTQNDGIMSLTSIKPIFGKHLDLNVTGANINETIVLVRISGKLVITIEDAIPDDLDSIAYTFSTKYNSLNVVTFNGYNGEEIRLVNKSVASKHGETNTSCYMNIISEVYGEQYTTDLTITSYKHDGTKYVRVVKDVPLASNTVTNLTGELFKGATSNITFNVTWEDPINGTM